MRQRGFVSFFLLVCLGALRVEAQTASTPAPAQVSSGSNRLAEPPGLVYKEAMHPLDVVRASFGNWSPSELTALNVAMRKAHEACDATSPEAYAGDDLCDLARLCALGQLWPQALDSARQCIVRGPEARRTHAYATEISAWAQMKNLKKAQETGLELLRVQPYDAEVAMTILGLKNALDVERNSGRTLELELAEQPVILTALTRHAVLTEEHGEALMSTGALYNSAAQLAFLQYYNQDRGSAAETLTSLDAAVGTTLNNEDAVIVERVHTQFHLLGTKLQELKLVRAFESPKARPEIHPEANKETILVLFPDWCASCRDQMKIVTEFNKLNAEQGIRAYGLVFHDDFGVKEDKPAALDWKDLEGTATLLVDPSTVRTLGATDYPLGVVVDHAGEIRFVGVMPDAAFSGDSSYIERVLLRVSASETTDSVRKTYGVK
jgi:thiol-disulfide isomerase/thioredoxin